MKTLLAALALVVGGTLPALGSAEIHVVGLGGMIHPVSAAYLEDAITRADAAGAAALVIEIDTPGGMVESTKEVIQKIFAAKTPIIGFVTPSGGRAASGGFFLLLACDAAAMAPGTNTGAAHPVTGAPNETKADIMMQKAESDLAAYARSIAENRGKNIKLAEDAVRNSTSWTETEALRNQLIDIIARDVPELLRVLDGRKVKRMDGTESILDLKGSVVRSRAMSVAERFQNFLLIPQVAFLLLGLGVLGIYVEFSHPGLILPGAAGALALMLFAYAAHILPINVFGLLLIALSVVLFAMEIKIVSHGFLGLGGVVALVAGSLILFNGDIPELRLPFVMVLPVSLAIAGIMFTIVTYVVRASAEHVATGREGMVGEIGVAVTDVGSGGKIFVHGEFWNARAEAPIPKGASVRIRVVEEMRVLVEPAGRQ